MDAVVDVEAEGEGWVVAVETCVVMQGWAAGRRGARTREGREPASTHNESVSSVNRSAAWNSLVENVGGIEVPQIEEFIMPIQRLD
jgi:hypothetical protein